MTGNHARARWGWCCGALLNVSRCPQRSLNHFFVQSPQPCSWRGRTLALWAVAMARAARAGGRRKLLGGMRATICAVSHQQFSHWPLIGPFSAIDLSVLEAAKSVASRGALRAPRASRRPAGRLLANCQKFDNRALAMAGTAGRHESDCNLVTESC